MQFSSAVLLVSAVSLVQAGCFTSGERWDNTNPAISAIYSVCNGNLGDHDYNPGELRSACVNFDGHHGYFSVQMLDGPGTANLPQGTCVDLLQREVTGCDRGGRSAYTLRAGTLDARFEFT